MTAAPSTVCQPVCHAFGLGCGCRPWQPAAVPVAAPAAARASILARIPTRLRVRVRLLEAKLNRERFVNAGLRARLVELENEHDLTLGRIAYVVNEQARTLGHAHPVIVGIRDELAKAPR